MTIRNRTLNLSQVFAAVGAPGNTTPMSINESGTSCIFLRHGSTPGVRLLVSPGPSGQTFPMMPGCRFNQTFNYLSMQRDFSGAGFENATFDVDGCVANFMFLDGGSDYSENDFSKPFFTPRRLIGNATYGPIPGDTPLQGAGYEDVPINTVPTFSLGFDPTKMHGLEGLKRIRFWLYDATGSNQQYLITPWVRVLATAALASGRWAQLPNSAFSLGYSGTAAYAGASHYCQVLDVSSLVEPGFVDLSSSFAPAAMMAYQIDYVGGAGAPGSGLVKIAVEGVE